MKSTASDFAIGFFAVARGIGLLASSPRVRRLAILPVLISILILTVGGFLGVSYLLSSMVPKLTAAIGTFFGIAPWGWLHWLVLLVFVWPACLIALFFFLYLLARICAAPFFALLAERVLIEGGLLQEQPFKPGAWLAMNARMLVVSLGKTVIFLILGLFLFALSFVLGVNLLAALGFLLFGP